MTTNLKSRIVGILMLSLAASVGACGMEGGDEPGAEQSQSPLSLGEPFYDTGTQCTVGGVTMHCCPPGTVMVGAHIGSNTFKCAYDNIIFPPTPIVDRSTQRNGMHACPEGMVMRGLHVGQNVLACVYPFQRVTPPDKVDYSTQDRYMHVCPGSYSTASAMSGIHVGMNKFLCAR